MTSAIKQGAENGTGRVRAVHNKGALRYSLPKGVNKVFEQSGVGRGVRVPCHERRILLVCLRVMSRNVRNGDPAYQSVSSARNATITPQGTPAFLSS